MGPRTLLYAPGNEPRKVQKVATVGSDAVILDLEDAVPVDEKVATRATLREAIPSVKANGGRVYVRINSIESKADFSVATGLNDLDEVVCPELDGLVVPKVESAKELLEIDQALLAKERSLGLSEGTFEVLPIIETALGMWNAFEIARSVSRIGSLHFGGADYTRDVNIDWTRDETELMYARSRLVMISRAAGIQPPTDSVWVRLEDDDGIVDSANRAKALGFQGKSCIHPKQIPIVNRAFSYVAPEDLAQAKKVVEAFVEAQARGSASIRVDGQFVDYPVVERAKRVIELHNRNQEGKE